MTRYFSILFAVTLLVPSVGFAQHEGMSHAAAEFSLTPDRGGYNPGESFSVRVTLNAPEPVTSVQASLLYDASRLTLVSIAEDKANFPYWWGNGFSPASPTSGVAMLQASSPAPGVQGSAIPVATITFYAKESGLAALVASQNSLVLNSGDTNVLDVAKPAGAIFTIGSLLMPAPSSAVSSFNRNLQRGNQGADVKALQQFLNAQGFQLASVGAGSPGQETEYFGPATQAALIRFQEMHASHILAPLGLQSGTGYFGASTRAYAQSL